MALKPLNFEYEGPLVPIPGVPKEKRHMTLLNGFRSHYTKRQMWEIRMEWVESVFVHYERKYIDNTDFESMMCCNCRPDHIQYAYYVSYVNLVDNLTTVKICGFSKMKEFVLSLADTDCIILDIQQEV